MIVLVALETILIAALTVLVAGLLRGYATVLRRLHELDGGEHRPRPFSIDDAASSRPVPVATPQVREQWTEGHDVCGVTVGAELVSTRVIGVEHDTVLLFLSSGCDSCEVFWRELAQPVRLPAGTRLVVVTQDEDSESPGAIAGLAAPGLDVIMSSDAWRDYEVPGSPHVVFIEGPTGRVRGEGTGQSWRQVAQLLARATGDPTFLGEAFVDAVAHPGAPYPDGARNPDGAPRAVKPARDAEVEADVDRELMAAGILPGDPRLYGSQE